MLLCTKCFNDYINCRPVFKISIGVALTSALMGDVSKITMSSAVMALVSGQLIAWFPSLVIKSCDVLFAMSDDWVWGMCNGFKNVRRSQNNVLVAPPSA